MVGKEFSKSPNIDEGSYKKGTQTKRDELAKAHTTDNTALNHEFYVYENKLGEIAEADKASANRDYANHTLLIVKGDYTYLPNGLADSETNYVKKRKLLLCDTCRSGSYD